MEKRNTNKLCSSSLCINNHWGNRFNKQKVLMHFFIFLVSLQVSDADSWTAKCALWAELYAIAQILLTLRIDLQINIWTLLPAMNGTIANSEESAQRKLVIKQEVEHDVMCIANNNWVELVLLTCWLHSCRLWKSFVQALRIDFKWEKESDTHTRCCFKTSILHYATNTTRHWSSVCNWFSYISSGKQPCTESSEKQWEREM